MTAISMKNLNNIIFWAYAGLVFFVPIVFTPWNSELFEFNKIVLVYFLTTVITCAWLIKMVLAKKFIFRKTFWDIPLLLFLTSQTISTIFSIDQLTSILGYYSRFNGGLLSTLCYTILYWGFVSNISKKDINRLIKFTFASGFLVGIYGITQHLGIDKKYWVQDVQHRVFSSLGQPNWLAAYLNILIFLALGQKSTIYYLLFTIYYITLLFTKSRSGFLGFIIPFGILIIHTLGTSRSLSLRLKKLGGVTAITLILSLLIGIPFSFKDKLNISFLSDSPNSQPVTDNSSNPLNITPSSDIRKIVWQGAIDLWKQNPVSGTGVETFGYSYYWVRPKSHNLTSEWDFLYNKAHNEFLNLAATTGSLGLATYLILIFTVSIFAIRNSLGSMFYILCSLVITNFFGFSVVTTSLFFFLLPAVSYIKTKEINERQNGPRRLDRLTGIFIFLIITIFLFLFSCIARYWLADINYAKAKKHLKVGLMITGFEQLNRAVKLNPLEPNFYSERSIAHAKLAAYFIQQNQKTEADKHVQPAINNSSKALKISPYHLNFYKNRVHAYYYLAVYDLDLLQEAIMTLKKAAELAPTDPKIPFNLGQIYQTLDQKKEAKKYYQKALDLKPNYQKAAVAIEEL